MPGEQQARRREEKMVVAMERQANALEKIARALEKKNQLNSGGVKKVDDDDGGSFTSINRYQINGTVTDAGGGTLVILVDRDTVRYPFSGQKVVLIYSEDS